MKLRNKILAFVAPAAAIAAVTPVALTSCNNNGENGPTTITASGEQTKTIKTNEFSLDFTLDKELPQYWSLGCKVNTKKEAQFKPLLKNDSAITVSGKKVSIAFGIGATLVAGNKSLFSLTITCRNGNMKDIWTQTIDGYTVIYQPA